MHIFMYNVDFIGHFAFCNLLMIKVIKIKNIYENLSYLHCQDSNFTQVSDCDTF